MAEKCAGHARAQTNKVMKTSKVKEALKQEIKDMISENTEIEPEEVVENKIKEKAFSIALDNLLIARTLNESVNLEKFNDWEGRIIEDAYKLIRDNLVESALLIVD